MLLNLAADTSRQAHTVVLVVANVDLVGLVANSCSLSSYCRMSGGRHDGPRGVPAQEAVAARP